MSVISAVVDLATNGVSAEAEALRELIGNEPTRIISDCWQGEEPLFPYVILGELQASVTEQARAGGRVNRVEQVLISFTVFGDDRASVESVIQAIDDLYMTKEPGHLTSGSFTHMCTTFGNRFSSLDSDTRIWRGQLELLFKITKV